MGDGLHHVADSPCHGSRPPAASDRVPRRPPPYTRCVDQLVECVPNISEGRRPEVVDAIAAAAVRVPGVTLLDRTSDVDHDRSVLTLAGDSGGRVAGDATGRRAGYRAHRPALAAGPASTHRCPGCRAVRAPRRHVHGRLHRAGPRLRRLARTSVSGCRSTCTRAPQPGPTGVSWRTSVDPGSRAWRRRWPPRTVHPDYGPRRPHPTAGATVVGARPFLIAWNIQLDTLDLGSRSPHRITRSASVMEACRRSRHSESRWCRRAASRCP